MKLNIAADVNFLLVFSSLQSRGTNTHTADSRAREKQLNFHIFTKSEEKKPEENFLIS